MRKGARRMRQTLTGLICALAAAVAVAAHALAAESAIVFYHSFEGTAEAEIALAPEVEVACAGRVRR